MRNRVTEDYLNSKIVDVQYHRLPGTTVTICNLLLQNGYSVRGESSCVDPDNFNEATGKRIAYENAVHALWPLEGYLLAEEIYRAKEVNRG